MWRRRLFWKLILPVSLIIVLCMAAVGGYLVQSQRQSIRAQSVDQLGRLARLADEDFVALLDFGRQAEANQVATEIARKTQARLTLIAPDGRVLADSEEDASRMENHRLRPEVAPALEGRPGSSLRLSATVGERFLYVAVPSQVQPGWVIRLALPFEQFARQVHRSTRVLVVGTVLAGLTAIVLIGLFVRRITQPLDAMRHGLQRLEQGELGVRLDVASDDEVGQLARSLNRAREQLEQTIANLTSQHNERDVILASMTEGLLAVDAEERVLLMNASARDLLGLDLQDVESRTLVETVRAPDFVCFVQQVRAQSQPMSVEIVLFTPEARWLDLRGAPLRLPEDKGTGAVVVFSDVTRLHRLEQARKDFVANVSHELKTPVTSIKGFLETLLEGGALQEPQNAERFLGKISKHTERLSAIIDDLLYLSRLEHEGADWPRQSVNLGRVVETCLADFEHLARQGGLGLTAQVEGPCRILGEESLLRRALDNLVDNAIKYTPAEGRVEVRLFQDGSGVVLEVRDEGIGIPEAHLPRITERFYRVDAGRSREMGGTGLGLAIAKHVALVHGGSLEVESTQGHGSIFRLRFPAAPPARPAAATPPV